MFQVDATSTYNGDEVVKFYEDVEVANEKA